ncbi:MAG: redox-sensing transcriptional repressor Rex [Dehalococcoidia bacterium]|nr:redox-sensing transcriptional repressor Rex [Dehalococcoidia bacterium]HCV00134.1 redox-sensing transcriptional repressor Rex [Dehalococcoidia bacterium]|tara:strand:+ start:551 stop:1189 length:639 start_codon:yes stop_codon:yes gene_type:complete
MTPVIPEVVINRLPLYARALATLAAAGDTVVSSQTLGEQLDVTPAQIRKDLSYFGRFGKQGRGYNVGDLRDQLRAILGLDRTWSVCVVGIGRLGQAILEYDGFTQQGFNTIAAFDEAPEVAGSTIQGIKVQSMSNLENYLAGETVDIAVVAVPAEQAQAVVDRLVKSGVQAILNYAPISAHVPEGVSIRQIDPVVMMQGMTYYLKDLNPDNK